MSIPENPWFLQAEDDLKMAKLAFANGFYSQTCYHASQSAEKALKSIIIDLGELPPKTHALNRLRNVVPNWAAYLRFRRFEIEFSYTHAYQHSVSF